MAVRWTTMTKFSFKGYVWLSVSKGHTMPVSVSFVNSKALTFRSKYISHSLLWIRWGFQRLKRALFCNLQSSICNINQISAKYLIQKINFPLSIAFRNIGNISGQQPLFKRKHCGVLPINPSTSFPGSLSYSAPGGRVGEGPWERGCQSVASLWARVTKLLTAAYTIIKECLYKPPEKSCPKFLAMF